jgi:hypothetical protein
MNRLSLAAAAAFALGAIGCTPSPEKTCNKLQELAEKDSSSSSKKPFKLSMSKCLENMNELKARDPEAYKCAAKMVSKLSSLDTAFLAISVCDKSWGKKADDGAASKSKDDDAEDEAPKKKKKKPKASDDE